MYDSKLLDECALEAHTAHSAHFHRTPFPSMEKMPEFIAFEWRLIARSILDHLYAKPTEPTETKEPIAETHGKPRSLPAAGDRWAR